MLLCLLLGCCCWGSGVVGFQQFFLSSTFPRSHVTAFSKILIISSLHLFTPLCFLGLLTRRLVYILWHLRNTIFQPANLLYSSSYRREPGFLPTVMLFKNSGYTTETDAGQTSVLTIKAGSMEQNLGDNRYMALGEVMTTIIVEWIGLMNNLLDRFWPVCHFLKE